MINKISIFLGLSLVVSCVNAGYGEINTVGDIRQLKDVKSVQSTVTDSAVWKEVSQNAQYYVVEDKNAEAKENAQKSALIKIQKQNDKERLANEKSQIKLAVKQSKADLKLQKKLDKQTSSQVNEYESSVQVSPIDL